MVVAGKMWDSVPSKDGETEARVWVSGFGIFQMASVPNLSQFYSRETEQKGRKLRPSKGRLLKGHFKTFVVNPMKLSLTASRAWRLVCPSVLRVGGK